MKISNLKTKIINETKSVAQKTQRKYQENISPQIDKIIDKTVDYTKENYPKAKNAVKNVYTRTKQKTQKTVDDFTTFANNILYPPKSQTLKEAAIKAQKKLNKQEKIVNEINKNPHKNLIELYLEKKKLAKLKEKADNACSEYNKFVANQELYQKEFEKANK